MRKVWLMPGNARVKLSRKGGTGEEGKKKVTRSGRLLSFRFVEVKYSALVGWLQALEWCPGVVC